MPDYLSCGSCPVDFELSDITRFIEHKSRSCVSSTEATRFALNLLECVKCLRKFNTPWPLLQHIQLDHQVNIVRNLVLPQPAVIPNSNSSIPSVPSFLNSSVFGGQHLQVNNRHADSNYSTNRSNDNDLSSQQSYSNNGDYVVSDMRSIETQTRTTSLQRAKCPASCCQKEEPVSVDTDDPMSCCPCNQESLIGAEETPGMSCCSGNSVVGDVHQQTQQINHDSKALLKKSLSCCPCPRRVPRETASRDCQTDFEYFDFDMDFLLEDDNSAQSLNQEDQLFPTQINANQPITGYNSVTDNGQSVPVLSVASIVETAANSILQSHAYGDNNMQNSNYMTQYAESNNLWGSTEASMDNITSNSQVLPILTASNRSNGMINQPMLPHGHNQIQPSMSYYTPGIIPTTINGDHTSMQYSRQQHNSTNNNINAPIDTTAVNLSPNAMFLTNQIDTPTSTSPIDQSLISYENQPLTSNGYNTTTSVSSNHLQARTSSPLSYHTTTNVVLGNMGSASRRSRDFRFTCVQCAKPFRQNVHLRKHVMAQHTKLKPHKCPHCGYTTVEKSHLTVHIRTHTGEKPYRCRNCAYSSAQNCTLKSHYLRRHPGSSVVCQMCGEPYVTEQERNNHQRVCRDSNGVLTHDD